MPMNDLSRHLRRTRAGRAVVHATRWAAWLLAFGAAALVWNIAALFLA